LLSGVEVPPAKPASQIRHEICRKKSLQEFKSDLRKLSAALLKNFKMADTVDKSNKRKKNTDGSSRPSKKVAIKEDRKIKISLRGGDHWAPIIGMQDTQERDHSEFDRRLTST
jgi:DNA-directed RNA polymerase I subunit RPA49